MAENHVKNEGRLKRFWGGDTANAPKDAEDTDMRRIFEEKNAASADEQGTMQEQTEEMSENGAAVEAENEIEKDAKEYYNSTHAKSIEEKIRNIHANALQSYAKEGEETASADESDNTQTEEPLAEEAAPTDIPSEQTPEDGQASDNAVTSGETRNYDMSQLINILKGQNAEKDADAPEEDAEESARGGRSKRKDRNSDELDLHDSELYEDVNEYYHDFEYTESAQSGALFKSFRKAAVVSSASMLLTLLAFLGCLWIELGHGAGLPFANFMHPGRYGRIYAMVSLQMLALCVFFNLDGLARGIRKFSLKRPAPEAAAVAVTALCTVQTIVSAVFAYESTAYRTFNFAGCLMLLVLSVNTFIKAYTRFQSLTLILSKKPKLTTQKLDPLADEYNHFAKYLNEDSEALAIAKTASVEDFVKHSYTVPRATASCNVLMYAMLALSVVVAVLCATVLNKAPYEAFNYGVLVFLFSTPIGMLLATALPFFALSMRASALHSTVLGEAAGDTFDNAGVLSFDDTEVFPPKAVKVTSIKTYHDHRIDKVIIHMAKIFNKLGGSLSYVFSSSVPNLQESDGEVMVIETAADGLRLKIGEDDILVGTGSYMRLYDIETPTDSVDETEMRSLTSILFLACNNQLAAKFYIRYTLNRQFESVLRGLYDAGICCGVRTFDPGIDDQLVLGSLKGANYPIHVIKKDAKEVGKVAEKLSGSVVTLSGIHHFLKTFLMLDKLSGVYKSNVVIAVLGAVVGLIASVGIVFAGITVSAVTLLVFQLVWLVPLVLVSVLGK